VRQRLATDGSTRQPWFIGSDDRAEFMMTKRFISAKTAHDKKEQSYHGISATQVPNSVLRRYMDLRLATHVAKSGDNGTYLYILMHFLSAA